jgi:hypothetical protein
VVGVVGGTEAVGVAVALADTGPLPMVLVDTTVNVWAVPLVRPVITHDVVFVLQLPDGEPVTV